MSEMDVFTIEDDFDPLAEVAFDAPDEEEQFNAEYMPPIPDAEQSVVPAPEELSPEERIERLLAGIPGQKFRALAVIEAAEEPGTAGAIVTQVDARFPRSTSVYDTARLLRLLTDAGAIACEGQPDDANVVEQDGEVYLTEDNFVTGDDGVVYLVVADQQPASYVATEDGVAAVARYIDAGVLEAIIRDEPRYAPLYARIMEMVSAEGGATTPQLDGAIDSDPLCEEPRRFCGYFLDKLETAGVVEWRDAWVVTDLGRKAIAASSLRKPE